jgi:hypothetical protein
LLQPHQRKILKVKTRKTDLGCSYQYSERLDNRGSILGTLLHSVLTGPGTHPTSYTMVPQRYFSEGITGRREPNHFLLMPRSRMTELYLHFSSVINPLEPSGYYMYHQP